MKSVNKFTFFLKAFELKKIIILSLFYFIGTSFAHSEELAEKPIVVITTSYNNSRWLKYNIDSILSQKYTNFRFIYVDDTSKDGTADKAEAYVKSRGQQHRFTLIRNTKRMGSLANIYYAVHSCKDDEIVVSVDGDDWLSNNLVLKNVNEYYSTSDIWLTHGTLVEYPNRNTSWSIPLEPEAIDNNSFRKYRCPSHLRTFYAWLFKKIKMEDLMYEGQFFSMAWDQAIMFPMIEMAGVHHAFIPDVNYVYNVANPINDNKIDPELQRNLEEYIRSKEPYERLTQSPLKNVKGSKY